LKINPTQSLSGFIRRNWSFLAGATAIFYGVNLSLTILAQTLAPPFERSPPMALIPENVLLDGAHHAALGFLLGCLTLDPALTALTTLFSVSIDLDHIFQLLHVSFLPRPAHSLVFLVALVGFLWFKYKRLDLAFASTSAFLGHIALDSSVFPLFSPIYFHYFAVPSWTDPVLILAAAALNAVYTYQRLEARRSKINATREAKTGLSESPHEG
jgi:hypothetical protein